MEQLILLHGAVGSKDQMQPLSEVLKDTFTVHLFNFSGHGGNTIPKEGLSVELFAADVLHYMKEQAIEQAYIFGYSMGGYVGFYLAKHFPYMVKKLVTLATKFYWDETVAAKEVNMLNAATIKEKVPAFAAQLKKRHLPADWEMLLERTQQLLTSIGAENVLKEEDYNLIGIQCLLLLGDRDKMVSLEETATIYKKLPNAALAVLPNTAHPIEQIDVKQLAFMIENYLVR